MKRALLIMAAAAAVSAPAMADEALAKSKNCMACHAVDKKLVGPSYKEVAKKYAGDAKAADMLA
ncbi:MAG: c-type cytochrome, partial [Hydrogenophaga sp.]